MALYQSVVSVAKVLEIFRFEAARAHNASPDTAPRFEATSWMDRSDMATALNSNGTRLAFACGRTLVVSHLGANPGDAAVTASTTPPLVTGGDVVHWMHCPTTGKPTSSTLAVAPGTQITCAAWVKVPRDFTSEELGATDELRVTMDAGPALGVDVTGAATSWHVLLLGTSSGHLQVHNSGGSLLMQQRFRDGPVMNIQVTTPNHGRQQDSLIQHITITYEDAVVQVPVTEVKRFMTAFQNCTPVPALESTTCIIPQTIQGRSDAVCMPHVRPLLDDMMHMRPAKQPLVLSVGVAPAIASFEVEEADEELQENVRSWDSATSPTAWSPTRLLGLAPSLFGSPTSPGKSTPFVRALDFLSGRQPDGSRDVITSRIIADDREVHSLSVAPCGNLAVCLDGKGRVLLLDMTNMCTIRIWKGYRDVHCGWLEHAVLAEKKDEEDSNLWTIPAQRAEAQQDKGSDAWPVDGAEAPDGMIAPLHRSASQDGLDASANPAHTKLYLVIYAPKREVVEVWPMRMGKKARSFRCGSNCALLQPGVAVGQPSRSALTTSGSQTPARSLATCYILNGTSGELFNLADRLRD